MTIMQDTMKTLMLGVIIGVLITGCISYFKQHENSKDSETTKSDKPQPVCALSNDLKKEIESYKPKIEEIMNAAINGNFTSKTYDELETFVDQFGPRFEGTQNLENSIDYALDLLKKYRLDNVHGESVKVPHWVRGNESATLISPRRKNLAMLGLGYSVGTTEDGIHAEAIVVSSFEELKIRAKEVLGKIVVYNQNYTTYGQTVIYRSRGASEAAKLGAVAVLIRSITPFSLYTPHTGMMDYDENVTKIPAACITVEDAQLLHRIAKKGKLVKIHLKMDAKMLPDVDSRNVIAEIKGKEEPEKIVVVSGHIDSWDVGQGAIDDGGGAFISLGALALLRSLDLHPKRTIRLIMWTAEEMGIIGASHYVKEHKSEEKNLQFVMESDIGTFEPLGLEVSADETVQCILSHILSMMQPIGNLGIKTPGDGPDIQQWIRNGVPGASLWNQNEKYFWYHHTNADMMNAENPENLDKGTALFAAVAYVVADLSLDFPRNLATKH